MRRRLNRGDVLGLTGIAVLTAAAAGLGGATGDFRSRWYRDLRKPEWQPPAGAIAAAWSVLYPTVATAGSLLWTRRREPGFALPAGLFGAQLALNAAWTPLFTRGRRLRLAAAECALLTGVNAGFAASARRVSPAAAALFIPYTAWTAFATYLTWSIARLNPGSRA